VNNPVILPARRCGGCWPTSPKTPGKARSRQCPGRGRAVLPRLVAEDTRLLIRRSAWTRPRSPPIPGPGALPSPELADQSRRCLRHPGIERTTSL